MMVVAMGLVCLMAVTGCKKRPRRGGIGGDNVGGIAGQEGYAEGLSDRFGGTELAGQFAAVYFDYDSAQINESERSKIEAVASDLKSGRSSLIVEGHCDERGSNEYNLSLGERRALAIRAYLVGLGLDGARVQTKSYGEERPVCTEHEEGCWSKNRRGEFVLVQ